MTVDLLTLLCGDRQSRRLWRRFGAALAAHGLDATMLAEAPMTLEDAFVGYTGAY